MLSKSLFAKCVELQPAMKVLLKHPTQLRLYPNENIATARDVNSTDAPAYAVKDMPELANYVYQRALIEMQSFQQAMQVMLPVPPKQTIAAIEAEPEEPEPEAVVPLPVQQEQSTATTDPEAQPNPADAPESEPMDSSEPKPSSNQEAEAPAPSEEPAEDVSKLTVNELRTKLGALGLPTTGLKKELVKRYTDALQSAAQ